METSPATARPTREVMLGLAATIIVLAGLHGASRVVAPALVGVLIAIGVIPLQRLLSKRLGRTLAFLATLVLVLLVILLVLALVGAGVAAFSAGLVQYASRSDDLAREASSLVERSSVSMAQVERFARERAESAGGLGQMAATAAEVVGGFGLTLLVIGFVLADAVGLREKASALDRMTEHAVDSLTVVTKDIRDFLRITGTVSAVAGALCTLLFWVAGVDYAPLWGLLIAGLGFVPFFGFWSSIIPPSVMAALEHGLLAGLGVALGCAIIHAATSSILKPKLVSDGLDLSPFTVFYSVVFWAFVFGPLGAIIAVPITLFVKEMLLEHDESLGWLSMLMGNRPEKATAGD